MTGSQGNKDIRSGNDWLLILMLFIPLSANAQDGMRPHVPLPDEPVRSAIFESCSACHGIDVYAYRAMDRAGWGELLDTIHKKERGVEISPRNEEILLDYLVENFGPETIPFPREYDPPEVTGFFSDADARVFLERTCAECHEIRVFNRRNTTEKWRELVLEMRSNGARLSDENLERLVEWLGRVRGPENTASR